MSKENKCPVCNEKPVLTCKCPRMDSECKNGHKWHTCYVHDIPVKGWSDHSTAIDICTCDKQ